MRIRERQQEESWVEFQIAWVGMLSLRKERYKTILPMTAELAALRVTNGEGNGTPLCTLAWKIPRMEEPGRLQSMGSLRVRHDWSDLAAAAGSLRCHISEHNISSRSEYKVRPQVSSIRLRIADHFEPANCPLGVFTGVWVLVERIKELSGNYSILSYCSHLWRGGLV